MIRKVKKIRTKIFLYIAGFAALILLILWMFQIVFLDDFYKYVKMNQIKSTASTIVSEIDNNSLENYLNDLSGQSDYCIRIIDDSGQFFFQNTTNKRVCGLKQNTAEEIVKLYQDAVNNDGEIIKTTKDSVALKVGDDFSQNPLVDDVAGAESMTMGKVVTNKEGNMFFIVIDGRITPMQETVVTLKEQFKIISVVLVALTAILAYFIAMFISKPIRKTNENAKKLAQGSLDIHFQGKGYLEIEELNETLNYAVEELSKVESLRNELIANMSHDLRTPLTMITGYSEVIRDLPNENTKENIQVIIDESQRLTNLVNNILELSKLQSKTESLQISEFNLTDTIKNIAKRFEVMLEKESYQIHFEFDREVIVSADEMRINQVVYNIVGNATHFTGEDRKVTIRQIIKEDVVRVEVEDTGNGIKEEDLPYVWDRYYKLKSNHKRQQAGSGIGLSIVQGVLELHKVDYGVVSELGKGAMFYFELPVAKK